MARAAALHRVTLYAASLQRAGEFYRDVWGMEATSISDHRWHLRSRTAGHADLALVAKAGAAGLASLALSARSAEDAVSLLNAVSATGARVVQSLAPTEEHPGEMAATVHDPDGNRVEIVVPAKLDGPSRNVADGPGPLRIGHVVLWTPRMDAMEAFYAALGIFVTDRTALGMSFLRCSTDHHSVALVKSSGRTGLQHIAFDVGTREAVELERTRLAALGTACFWGPGRHGPGNNVFSYYHDPLGNIIEFYGEMQQVSVDERPAQPVYWGPEHRGDITGVAGPAPAEFRS